METESGKNGNGRAETALAVRGEVMPSPFDPRTYAEAMQMATDFAASKLTKCRTPQQAILIMATGRDLGISATTALRMIYVADFGQGDQVTLSADLMVALCLRQRDICAYFDCVETTDEIATYETQRVGRQPRRQSFSIKDKERALLGRVKEGKNENASNWAKYPSVMLRHRAASLLARQVYPDIIGGFYTEDEMREVAVDAADAKIVDAEVLPLHTTPIESTARPAPAPQETDEERRARFRQALLDARSEAEGAKVTKEITSAYPDQAHPARVALKEVLKERKAVKWGPPPVETKAQPVAAEPAHDADGVVVDVPNLDDPDAYEAARARGEA